MFVDQLIKMVRLAAVPESIHAHRCNRVFIDTVFRLQVFILRYMLVVFTRTIITTSLPRTKISVTLKNPQQIIVIPEQAASGPAVAQIRYKPPLSRRAGDEARARSQVERAQSLTGLSSDRHDDDAQSPSSHGDGIARAPRPLLTRIERGHGSLRSFAC